MNINQIKYFVSVFEQQSFSLAAQKQCVTVQAVSKAIGDLERDFDEKLFIRSNHGAEPTKLGIEFYKRAFPVIEAFEGLESFARGEEPVATAPKRFDIALAAPNFLNNEGICKAFSVFISQNTNFDVNIVMVSPTIAQQELEAHKFCSLITIGKYENPQVNCLAIGTLPTGVCIARTHPLAAKSSVTLAELAEYPAGMSPICDSFNESILKMYKKRGLVTNIREVQSLSEDEPSFMNRDNGYFFSAIFPLSSQQPSEYTIIPIARQDQIEVPICSVTLKQGGMQQYRIIENFLVKAIAGASKKA